jgi:hypothetical protein
MAGVMRSSTKSEGDKLHFSDSTTTVHSNYLK